MREPPAPRPPALRRLAGALVMGVCLLLVVRVFGVEPYEVPTGSMAPAIRGRHRAVCCPRCGAEVCVGRHPTDPNDGRSPCRGGDRGRCPNCGCDELGLADAPDADGDHVLVSKTAFLFRQPRRWELIVFRWLGKVFIKRVVGLPGELLELIDGDVYADGRLARKTLAECRAQRVLVFDNTCQPGPDGWKARWVTPEGQPGPHPLSGTELRLDGAGSGDAYRTVAYHHVHLGETQSRPVRDEYVYNGDEQRSSVPVHDFLVECEVVVEQGEGHILLSLNDGLDTVLAELPVSQGEGKSADLGYALRSPVAVAEGQPTTTPGAVHAVAHAPTLRPGRTYRVEMAFVDRRVSVAVDGTAPLPPVDLPAARSRPPVERPVVLGARGARVVFRNFKLFRDVHYTQAGRNGVGGKAVRLGAEQYFVLGDNSPNSDDSRFWPGGGAVPAAGLVGKPFLVHLPSRVATWDGPGGPWESRVPDFARVRWLR